MQRVEDAEYYLKKILSNPFCLKKVPLDSVTKIDNMKSRFTAICQIILKKQISVYNEKRAEIMRQEMLEKQR